MKVLPLLSSVAVVAVSSALSARAEIPAVLTDQIYQGSGVINLLKDVSAADLGKYLLQNQGMYLAVDVNENASGLETAGSQGVAIKQMSLILSTSSGDFSFSDFVTSSTAMLVESGSKVAQQYYTLFGTSGSNDLTSATTNFSLAKLDDVITFKNINFTGEITSARLEVKFVNVATGAAAGSNENFFDFTGGFEDFAILSPTDAKTLEVAALGQADAPTSVTYAAEETPLTQPDPVNTTTTVTADPAPAATTAPAQVTTVVKTDPVSSVPAAPAPPFLLLAFGAGILALQRFRSRRSGDVLSA